MKLFLFLGLALSLACLGLCQDNTTTTTFSTVTYTTYPTTSYTTFSTTSFTTTTLSTTTFNYTTYPTPTYTTYSTTSFTTSTSSDNTTTTTTTTSTTQSTTTSFTTQSTSTQTNTTISTTVFPPTSTPDVEKVFNFTVPNNSSVPPCLRAKFSLSFNILYLAEKNNTKSNETLETHFENYNDFYGECNETFNSLSIRFHDDWVLFLNYTLKNSAYQLDTIRLNYTVDSMMFPDVSKDYVGKKYEEVASLNEFSANKGNSYKCTSKSTVSLKDNVKLEFKNYQAEPFLSSDSKTPEFDTAIECAADTTGTSKLVPIIVGSALAVLVVLVLLAYIIGRRKHRPGYQQV